MRGSRLTRVRGVPVAGEALGCGEQKTIRLAPLRTLEPEQPSYATLRETVERVGRRPSSVG